MVGKGHLKVQDEQRVPKCPLLAKISKGPRLEKGTLMSMVDKAYLKVQGW